MNYNIKSQLQLSPTSKETPTSSSLVDTIQPFYLPKTCNPRSNFSRILDTYKVDTIENKYSTFAQSLFPVHGTTIQRWLSIIKDNYIYAHHTLASKKPEIYKDRISNATDKLDISLWLDKYVFLNIWRVNPWDIHDMYFCFWNNIINKTWTLVSLKEIVHYGGLVSEEAEGVYKDKYPTADTHAINEKASKDFLENVMTGKDFSTIFPYFLQKEYASFKEYQQNLSYPWVPYTIEERSIGKVLVWAREGPQLQVPSQLDVTRNLEAILVVSCSDSEKKLLKKSVHEKKYIFMDDILPLYGKEVQENFKINQLFRAIIINTTLRDIEYVISQKPKNFSVAVREHIRNTK
jgi:hypothetical protein